MLEIVGNGALTSSQAKGKAFGRIFLSVASNPCAPSPSPTPYEDPTLAPQPVVTLFRDAVLEVVHGLLLSGLLLSFSLSFMLLRLLESLGVSPDPSCLVGMGFKSFCAKLIQAQCIPSSRAAATLASFGRASFGRRRSGRHASCSLTQQKLFGDVCRRVCERHVDSSQCGLNFRQERSAW